MYKEELEILLLKYIESKQRMFDNIIDIEKDRELIKQTKEFYNKYKKDHIYISLDEFSADLSANVFSYHRNIFGGDYISPRDIEKIIKQ